MELTPQGIIIPTDEEDAEINRGIALDPDTFEITDEFFKGMKPYAVWMREHPDKVEPPAE